MRGGCSFVLAAACVAGLAAAVDECSMYSDSCYNCLNITDPSGVGNRGSCGWCANGVTFHDQTLGPKCIDQR
jgi:hypothetical protein